ncbi:hypothetical protein C8J56DRAFT_1161970 [Mycena floridula]|nr:hypothetical protein C8J56DRAFT_1161970 [Mycena floridula]
MPTTTTTVSYVATKPSASMQFTTKMKPILGPSSSSSTATTLRTLYNRAARAFLTRDVVQTQSLLEAAVSILQQQTSFSDSLAVHRRKWDILRITLETTIHSSPPAQSSDSLPDSLKEVLLQTPHSLINSSYARSLKFFMGCRLPSQVLITLVYSSLKLECPDVGRIMIEDWLARRERLDDSSRQEEEDGYEKILEIYCLQVLPKLEQWEYAAEFLDYESELQLEHREHLKESFSTLRDEAFAPPILSPSSSSLTPPPSSAARPFSPASSSSSSSSLSTTSTHTVVPATPRGNHSLVSLSTLPQASLSSASISSTRTARPDDPPSQPHSPRVESKRRQHSNSRTSSSSGLNPLSLPRSPPRTSLARPTSPGAYTLVKQMLAPYLTASNLSTLLLLVVVVPVLSFLIRLRRRRRLLALPAIPANTSELVRKRLEGAKTSLWTEAVRVVWDAVRMAGSGLV